MSLELKLETAVEAEDTDMLHTLLLSVPDDSPSLYDYGTDYALPLMLTGEATLDLVRKYLMRFDGRDGDFETVVSRYLAVASDIVALHKVGLTVTDVCRGRHGETDAQDAVVEPMCARWNAILGYHVFN